jgi:Tfp pilus assembly protein PilF
MLYAQLNDTDQAVEYWQQALALRPDYPEVLNNLGVLFVRQGRTAEAQEQFQKAIRVAADFDQPYLNLAQLYMTLGEKTQAREILQQWLARHPEHAAARSMLEQLSQ